MRKFEIAHRVHKEAGIPEEDAVTLVNWIIELFKTTLQRGEPISIANFGVFTVRSKTPRLGRNPRTREAIMIKARRVVIFRASARFKAEVSAAEQPKKWLLPKGTQEK